MNKLVVGLLTVASTLFMVQPSSAISSDIVISQVQAGASSGTGAATQEFITIYNNSPASVDITNWCLHSNSGEIGCLKPEASNETIYLKPQAYALVVSATFLITHPESVLPVVSYDVVYPVKNANSGSIVGGSDMVRLVDGGGNEKDAISWSSTLSGGQLLSRKASTPGVLIDTDEPSDFTKTTTLTIPESGVTYLRLVVDICPTIDGLQETMPEGYGYDDAGNCDLLSSDLCGNIANIQLEYPEGMLADEQKTCMVDICENIAGLQTALPASHAAEDKVCYELERRTLVITELLANVSGSDSGREFIELYNPNDEALSLSGYVLQIGKTFESEYQLSDLGPGAYLEPYSYLAIYDSQLGFTLLNTNSSIRVLAPAGNIVSEVQYSEPADDQSWSFFDNSWAYTHLPTPGQQNQLSFVEEAEVLTATTGQVACTAGKYRHPITNRCRNIENDTVMLAACDNDEYRNPETNRCRKTATLASTLAACAEGYERNTETNRCRKEGTTTTLAPCQTGYERNLETNRCRKALLVAASDPNGSGAVVQEAGNNVLTNALIITAGLSAAGYGLYEWRSEFFRGLRRLAQLASSK